MHLLQNAIGTLDPPDWASFRRQAQAMLDGILHYLEHIRERPVWRPIPDRIREQFHDAIPREPADLTAVHDAFLRNILPYSSGNAHPGFMGWVQGGGTPVGMLAEMLAAGMNSNLGGRDHVPLEVERQIVEWMREIFSFPRGATGLFLTGSSMANLTAVTIARDAALGMNVRLSGVAANPKKLAAYASIAVHGCIQKAMDVCGLGSDALRLIPTDRCHHIDIRALERTIESDRRAGFTPFLIIGTAGTVDIGAIDDLTALADISRRQKLWFHVDGAYAALAIVSKDLAPRLNGIERADSLALDFHKWAQVPYSAGFLMVRDGTLHRDAFDSHADYLRREGRGLAAGSTWPCDLGVDLSRSFQALKTWFTLKVYGVDALGSIISESCALARYLEKRIVETPDLELLAPVQLNIVCFRFRAPQADRVNARIVIELHESGLVAPSTTMLDGQLAIRAAIVNHRTTRREIDLLVEKTVFLGQRMTQAIKEARPYNEAAPQAAASDWPPYQRRLTALDKLDSSLAADPQDLGLRVSRAQLLGELGRVQEAREEYLAVLTQNPTHRTALNDLGTLLYGTGYRTAARTAYAEAVAHYPDDVASLINLANVLVEEGEAAKAREHFAAALRLDPDHASAHQGLARALMELGDGRRAELHRRTGFARNSLVALPYRGKKPPVNVLLLVSALGGNPPVRHFLDERLFQTFVLTAEYHDDTESLPAHHVAFNAIGDADLAGKALIAAESLLAHTSAPVINSPCAVSATGRTENARRLRRLPGVIAPITATLPRELLETPDGATVLARHGLEFPLLFRTPGFHTGRHFVKIERAEDLERGLAELPGRDLTVIQFLDARGSDGKTRKYRVMMIDGKLYPLHAAVSSHWKIHYFTAEMADHPHHRAEDAAFLENMAEVLGEKAMTALTHIQATLGLDYAGIDFGLNETGEVLLFEANATMVVPRPARSEEWAYRWPAVERIYTAVREMLIARSENRHP